MIGAGACATAGNADTTDDSGVGDDGGRVDADIDAGAHDGRSDSPSADSAPGSDGSTQTDSSQADSSTQDSSMPDSGSADTAPPDTGPPSDGGCAQHGFVGALATYNLSAQTGSEVSAPATATAAGVTAGVLTRASGLTPVSGAGSINSSNWSLATNADPTKYYTFTVTPPAGCTLALTTLALDVSKSGTGPASGSVATSVDAFATHTMAFAGTSTGNVSFSTVSGSSAIEVRVYGYAATATGGTWRIQNTMTLNGTIN